MQPSKQTCSLVKILIDTGTAPTVCHLASTLLFLPAMQKERSCPWNCVCTSVAKPCLKSGHVCCIYRAQDKHFSIPPAVPWAAFLTSASSNLLSLYTASRAQLPSPRLSGCSWSFELPAIRQASCGCPLPHQENLAGRHVLATNVHRETANHNSSTKSKQFHCGEVRGELNNSSADPSPPTVPPPLASLAVTSGEQVSPELPCKKGAQL